MEDTAEVEVKEVKIKNKKKTGDGLRRAALKGRVSSLPKHSARDALIEDAEVEFSLGQQPQRCSWPPKGGEGEGREASERLKELMRLHAERKENSEKRLQDLAGSAEDAEMLAVSVLRREANEGKSPPSRSPATNHELDSAALPYTYQIPPKIFHDYSQHTPRRGQ